MDGEYGNPVTRALFRYVPFHPWTWGILHALRIRFVHRGPVVSLGFRRRKAV